MNVTSQFLLIERNLEPLLEESSSTLYRRFATFGQGSTPSQSCVTRPSYPALCAHHSVEGTQQQPRGDPQLPITR